MTVGITFAFAIASAIAVACGGERSATKTSRPSSAMAATDTDADGETDQALRFVVAGTFGAGACAFDNCTEYGWTGTFAGSAP